MVRALKALRLDPTALGHMAVPSMVGTSARDIVPLGVTVAFQVGVEARVKGMPIVDGLEPRGKGRPEHVLGRCQRGFTVLIERHSISGKDALRQAHYEREGSVFRS